MGEVLFQKVKEISLNGGAQTELKRTPFGKEMRKHFSFDPEWRNLNHGSFGAAPNIVRKKQAEYQELCETAPDTFIRYTYPELLDKSRTAIAKVLNAPVSTIVFVPNATTGVNTALRNIVWNDDGRDEILYFSTIYGACGNTVEYICEVHNYKVNPRKIETTYPISDADLTALFKDTIAASRAAGKNPRVAIYDTISSVPGLRFPYEALTKVCKDEGVISIIDGAHGVGHIPIDLTAVDPDYFVSNAHKWLSVPRGCAVFYVPERNHHLVRSTLPTSHGFVPLSTLKTQYNPLPPSKKSVFVNNFEFVGTIDNTNYLVVAEAIKWREEVCGGEQAIIDYTLDLAQRGAKKMVEILGTEILDNEEKTLTKCALFNVRLPFEIGDGEGQVKQQLVGKVHGWLMEVLIQEFKTFIMIHMFQGKFWARLSSQIYLDEEDFEWAAKVLKELSERVKGKSDQFWELS